MTASDDVTGKPGSAQAPVTTRTCIGCRQRAPATALLRVVVSSGSIVVPDPRRRAPGRGAWLHPIAGCVELAERRRAFGRALKVAGPLDPTPVHEYVLAEHTLGEAGTMHDQNNPTSGNPQE